MKVLSKELPEKDSNLAEKFINNREFNKLLEIVVSDIYLVQHNAMAETPKEKFLSIDLDKLIELELLIREYLSEIDSSYDSDNNIIY
jgi:hypothetical protein